MNPESLTVRELAPLLGLTERGVRQRADREQWQCATEGRARFFPLVMLPEDARAAILTAMEKASKPDDTTDTARNALWADWERAKAWRRKIADNRMGALIEVVELIGQGLGLNAARAQVSARLVSEGVKGGASVSAVKAWGRLVKDVPRADWLPYLLPDDKGRPPVVATHPHAWLAFKRLWLRPEKPAATDCYRHLEELAAANPQWGALPSLSTFKRRLGRLDRDVKVLAREGKEALRRTRPPLRRDTSHLEALEIVNADGHKFDVMVRFKDGTTGRPILVGWQDVASRKIIGYAIGKTEDAELVRRSLGMAVEKYGLPKKAHMDNGRAFASKTNTGGAKTRFRFTVKPEEALGVLPRLGITPMWAQPYNGQAKLIERAWRDFAQSISKRPEFEGAYTGNSPDNKPTNYGSKVVPWDVFETVVADGIAEHNARRGRKGGDCKGRSFDEAFAEKYARTIPNKASAAQLRMLLLASKEVKANEHGVHLFGNGYWSEAISCVAGERVVVRYDPRDLHGSVHVYRLGNEYVGQAECLRRFGFDDVEKASSHARDQRQHQKATNEKLRLERAIEAGRPDPWNQQLPRREAAALEAKVVSLPSREVRDAAAISAAQGPAEAAEVADFFGEHWRRQLALKGEGKL